MGTFDVVGAVELCYSDCIVPHRLVPHSTFAATRYPAWRVNDDHFWITKTSIEHIMEESTIQQPPPRSRPSGLPMSPKPHLFGDAPPKTERVLISDVLTPDDYRRWRWNSTKRAIFGSIGGGLLTAFLVRRFYPRKLNTNSVILAGFSGLVILKKADDSRGDSYQRV